MKRFLILFLGSLLFLNTLEAQMRVVDGVDDTPLPYAAIFDAAGNVVGFANSGGELLDVPETAYPITVRCIGYENLIIEQPGNKDWLMIPKAYELEAVTVSAKREVLKQTFYSREYITFSNKADTVTFFIERMADRYLPADKNVKFNKNFLCERNARCYLLFKVGAVDSVFVFQNSTIPSMQDLIDLNSEPVEAPKSFNSNTGAAKLYEKKGKSGMSLIQKQNAHTFTMIEDRLAKKKDHSMSFWPLKLLGMSLNINELNTTHVYHVNNTGLYLPKDMVQAGMVMEALGKGKFFRKLLFSDKPADVHIAVELYVVDREYLSKEEANEEYKNKKLKVPFEIPASVPQLNAATIQLVKRANAIAKK